MMRNSRLKYVSCLLVLLIIVVSSIIPVAAANQSIIINLNDNKTLANATLLDKNSVLKIANYHINSYMKNDVQTKGRNIVSSNDFTNLYDLNDNLFAYMIPLLEKGKEIGFITVGAIDDGFDVYEIYISDNYVSKVKVKMEQQKNLLNKNADSKLVFIPPQYYAIKVKDAQNEKYFDISKSIENEVDVTESFISKKPELEKEFNNIRSNENKGIIQKNINNSTNMLVSNQVVATVTEEDVRLVNEAQGSFVPVDNNGIISYGGDQNWWTDSTKQSRGCGPTVAANITCYLARRSPSTWGNLYRSAAMDVSEFLSHMDTMYNYLNPGPVGLTSVDAFAAGVEAYARSLNVPLNRVTDSSSFTLNNTANYIKAGLNSDCPVATLILQPPYTGYDFAWHWMTITKYYRDINDNRWIAVSSWSSRYSINYRTHFSAMNNYLGGGLMYFK